MTLAGLTLSLLLTACDAGVSVVKEVDTISDVDISSDGDGDGYLDDEDCDPNDGDVNPGATEICNGIDDDCDGDIDDGVGETWYADEDGDGFGDEATGATACEAPYHYVSNGEDCDDADATAYPSNPEICDGVDNDCNGVIDNGVTGVWYWDLDGDGYGDAAGEVTGCDAPEGAVDDDTDCDDTSDAVHPGADEVCDALDDDCDGAIDEGLIVTVYADGDGDGHGDPLTTSTACGASAGWVATGDDCDDASPAAFPGATETCDGVDDDCDGFIDEDDASDVSTWYLDFDGDGYGSDRLTDVSCTAPAGYVADATDCDDAVATVHPGATEACNEVDDDCDGVTDDGVVPSTWYRDADGDTWGDPDVTTTGCTAPSGYVADDGDCDDGDASVSPSATETCDGLDEDCSGNADDGGVCPCDVDWYGDHPYLFCDGNATWSDARAECQTYGYDLVGIADAAEDDWLVSVASTYTSATNAYWWTGATDALYEGSFGWVDGTPWSYTRWNSGEPNNLDDEDCGTLTYDGDWNDWDCGNLSTWICEAD